MVFTHKIIVQLGDAINVAVRHTVVREIDHRKTTAILIMDEQIVQLRQFSARPIRLRL